MIDGSAQRARPEDEVLDRPHKLLTFSLACLGLALVMPSVRFQVFGSQVDLTGLQATYSALGLGRQGLGNALVQSASETWRYLGLTLAGAMNVTFALAAIALARQNRGRRALRWLAACVALGCTLAAIAPWMPENPPASVLIGYYLWLLAYGALLSAVLCAWRQREQSDGLDKGH